MILILLSAKQAENLKQSASEKSEHLLILVKTEITHGKPTHEMQTLLFVMIQKPRDAERSEEEGALHSISPSCFPLFHLCHYQLKSQYVG